MCIVAGVDLSTTATRNSGMIASGIANSRTPAADFGGPTSSRPFTSELSPR